MSNRIDKEMLERQMVKTRSQARMLIEQGDVYCNEKLVSKPGLNVTENDQIEIRNRSLFVSRGAYKLEKALNMFNIDPKDKVVADIGASTGGFTQLLLQRGAKKIYCIDVGHDQLHEDLKGLPQVVNMEGVNIKYPLELPEKVDLCVVDLSFISIKQVYHNIQSLLAPNGKSIILVKPQFEAGKERLGKNGLVKNEGMREEIFKEVLNWFTENDYSIIEKTESPIAGKTGNLEYLIVVEA